MTRFLHQSSRVLVLRIADSAFVQLFNATDITAAALSNPVVLLRGQNHMQFASGTAPSNVASNDLKAEVSASTATSNTKDIVTTWLRARLSDAAAKDRLLTAVQNAMTFFQPIVQ